jgi:hypothetical protein
MIPILWWASSAARRDDAGRLPTIHDAQKYGARVALFGRKINHASINLRSSNAPRITDGQLKPEEAVRAYHGVLQGKGIRAAVAGGGFATHRYDDELRRTRDGADGGDSE